MIKNKISAVLFSALASLALASPSHAAIVSTGEFSLTDIEIWSTGHLVLTADSGVFDNAANTCGSTTQAFILTTHAAYKQFLAMALTASVSGQNVNVVYDTNEGCSANRTIVTKFRLAS